MSDSMREWGANAGWPYCMDCGTRSHPPGQCPSNQTRYAHPTDSTPVVLMGVDDRYLCDQLAADLETGYSFYQRLSNGNYNILNVRQDLVDDLRLFKE